MAFVVAAIGVSRLLVSPAASLGHVRQKKAQGTHCCYHLGPKVLSQSAFFSFFSVFDKSRVLAVLSGKSRETCVYSILFLLGVFAF